MSGLRLVVGFVVMGIAVPIALFYLLALHTLSELFTLAATTFLGWGVAELAGTILSRTRLADRSPSGALRQWEVQQDEEQKKES
ncbi:MAG: hypothetical protein WBX15_19730 [Thermoanaerobaculia bacterium]